MLIEEQERTAIKLLIRVEDSEFGGSELLPQPMQPATDIGAVFTRDLSLFEQIAPASFAERYPRLMFCAVAATILLATLMAEVDCLRGSGYFWR